MFSIPGMPWHPKSGAAFYAKTSDLAWLGVSLDQAGFGALAPAFFALRFARFFARLAVPAKSLFALFRLRRVSSILE